MFEKVIRKCRKCAFSVEFDNTGTEQEQKQRAVMAAKRLQDHVALTHPRQWALFLQKFLKWRKKNPEVYNDAFLEKFVEEK